jgi:integrase
VLNINIRQSTNLKIPIQKWNLSRNSIAFRDFLSTAEGRRIFRKLEDIRLNIDERIISGRGVTSDEVRHIVHEIVYKECLIRERKAVTVESYARTYLEQVERGTRKTQKGLSFSHGTIKSIRMTHNLLKEFQDRTGRRYGFDDIDFDFRTKFLDFLYNEKVYNVNTAAKCLNTLITIIAAAEVEDYHSNRKCLSPQFRAKRIEVDTIYLTREELIAMTEADISHLSPIHEIARDIFMVGIFTAQRVSDYNNISRQNIIHNEDGSVIINIRQKKTGVWVSIPARDELKQILIKYDYNLPAIAERMLNSCIKEVGKVAGINTLVTVERTSGGVVSYETRPKYELIQSHTARRTAATLMYLAGMDVFNICSVTGHSSIAMLKKYIKADEIDRARTISSDAAFTKW